MSETLTEKIYKDLIETDPDMQNMNDVFHLLLEGMSEDEIKTLSEMCMQIVAVYEYVLSRSKSKNLWENFVKTLEECNHNEDNRIDPMEYVKYYNFKLKCILSIAEFGVGNYKTLEEAVYAACSGKDYRKLERAVGKARRAEYDRKTSNYSSSLVLPF
ncbi:MAG: hypothetical protein IIW48_04820 [Clostridia bacterium]|nr:hypothetical protein [Clostridia bacterium]